MEVLILLGLIVLNGVFAMSEIALVTARKARLHKLATRGDKSAKAALRLAEDPTAFLSTVQIGITSIGILNGIVGEAVLAAPVAKWLVSLGVASQHAGISATVLVVVTITYASIVIGELVPKRLGQLNPELVARLVARPMKLLAWLTHPFVWLLSASTHAVMKLLGNPKQTSTVTEEEIRAVLDEGSEAGVIEQNQHLILRNLFKLDRRLLSSLMIPQDQVVYLDRQQPLQVNLQRMLSTDYSRFPVCDGSLHQVVGVVYAKQALAALAQGQQQSWLDKLHPCVYVPEDLTGLELLEEFRRGNTQMVFVMDEQGEIEGILTLEDVLDALMAEQQRPLSLEQGSSLLEGSLEVLDLKELLQLEQLPEESEQAYHTLGGMLMLLLSRVPQVGDSVDWQQWRFEVVQMEQKRVALVRVTALTVASAED
ncbi:hemolysin family protein [Balneatrix alpica]|uniref:Hemolysin family protein n=1 Tax=Balneatrix alpica TaxID=75684 RepID=A0ABV5ZIP4_9GAMM|nr:hemolysin family protein [Balneatrix alpica]